LIDLARRPSASPEARAEAIVGLSSVEPAQRDLLMSLAADSAPRVRHEALRSLRGAPLSSADRARLAEATDRDEASSDLAALVLGRATARAPRPEQDLEGWLKDLEGPADPGEGQRIFFHPRGPGCFRCHSVAGRGGSAGPDLSTTAGATSRSKLVESILLPSKEVAPQFVPWVIARTDGSVATGLLVQEGPEGSQTYVNDRGERFQLKAADIAERRPVSTSIMPDGIARTLTLQEFRDLLAFLLKPE
jgi:putative heme-binding domain-containing protein